MSTPITMPQLGESVAEGTIGRWLKQPGDRVEKDEPLAEIITDKVNAELPSPVAGQIEALLVDEGATVAVGTAIARVGAAHPGAPASRGRAERVSRRAATAVPHAPDDCRAPEPHPPDGARRLDDGGGRRYRPGALA